VYTRNCIESSNLSFTATLSKHKPLIFLEKVGGLWFLASGKGRYGSIRGNTAAGQFAIRPIPPCGTVMH
jgi:hypothetical protein